jgi:cysteine desulfuration protein SufE
MSPAEKQRQLVARFALIEDTHERLAAIVDWARRFPPLAEAEKSDAHRVPGCISRVWLLGTIEEGRCRFRLDADSALVKGLAALVCVPYDGATPAEAANFSAGAIEALDLAARISPTRLHGLAQVQRAIRAFAIARCSEIAP